ncbi:MAG: hypothetical protein WKF75_09215 [Singulisphaera sp.]
MRRSVILLAPAWVATALLTTTPGSAQIQKVETKPVPRPKVEMKTAPKTTTVIENRS